MHNLHTQKYNLFLKNSLHSKAMSMRTRTSFLGWVSSQPMALFTTELCSQTSEVSNGTTMGLWHGWFCHGNTITQVCNGSYKILVSLPCLFHTAAGERNSQSPYISTGSKEE